MQIFFKLDRYNPQNIFCHFFRILNFSRLEYYQSVYIDSGYLVRAIRPIDAYLFETSQVFLSLSEDVHVVWI